MITFTLTPAILGTTIISSHDASCIMNAQERSFQIMSENAIVTNETVEEQVASPIRWIYGHIPSMIRHPIPYIWCGHYPIDSQSRFSYTLFTKKISYQPYTSFTKKEVLIGESESEVLTMKVVSFLSHVDESKCIGCGKCENICPSGAITVAEKIAHVDDENCVACNKCRDICPEDAVTMMRRPEPMLFGKEPDEVDEQAIEDLCRKAHMVPDQFICACTMTLACEAASAILKGARTPEDLTRMTGVRSGCGIYCMGPIQRLLKAHGIILIPPKGHRWYELPLSVWDVPEDVEEKYPDYYIHEDKELYDVANGTKGEK